MKTSFGCLYLFLVVSLSSAYLHAGEDFPSAEQKRKQSAEMERQERDREALMENLWFTQQKKQLEERINSAVKGPALWNRDHKEGELCVQCVQFLTGQGYKVEAKTDYYYADDCGCKVGWGCPHNDPVDKRCFTYYEISW